MRSPMARAGWLRACMLACCPWLRPAIQCDCNGLSSSELDQNGRATIITLPSSRCHHISLLPGKQHNLLHFSLVMALQMRQMMLNMNSGSVRPAPRPAARPFQPAGRGSVRCSVQMPENMQETMKKMMENPEVGHMPSPRQAAGPARRGPPKLAGCPPGSNGHEPPSTPGTRRRPRLCSWSPEAPPHLHRRWRRA
jgi:hypothetical protein